LEKSSRAAIRGILTLIFLFAGSVQVVHGDVYVHEDQITFQWQPASGCVDRYEFYVSKDGGSYRRFSSSIRPDGTRPLQYVLAVEDSSVYQVRVRAVCDSYGPGPYSDPSDRVIVFLSGSARDTDGDRMPDAWELANGLDPFDPGDAAEDADSDLLSNRQEYQNRTDPWDPDSDQDGVTDWEEVAAGMDPMDPADNRPLANAGPDQERNPYVSIALKGSDSWDPNGDPLSFSWAQEAGPSVGLSKADQAICRFVPTESGDYVFSLVVSDGRATSQPDEVMIRVRAVDSVPVAMAGRDFRAPIGGPVILDGSGSYDPDGIPLGYSWRQRGGPAAVSLDDPASESPRFFAPSLGTYILELTVDNGQALSAPDRVTVVVVSKLSPGDVYPQGSPDGVLTHGDGIMIWWIFLSILEPTPEEFFSLDVGPMKIVDGSQSPIWIRLQPDGRLDATDGNVLSGIFKGTYRSVGWEFDAE